MSVTNWKFIVVVITKNKQFGKQLAKLAATFPDDPGSEDLAFEDGYILDPQAWAMLTPATQKFVDAVTALTEDAPLDDPRIAYLASRGLTASLWAQAKNNLAVASYQLWQDDGTYTPQDNFLEDFITAQGYTYTAPEPVAP